MRGTEREMMWHCGLLMTRAEVVTLEKRRTDNPKTGPGSVKWWAFAGGAADLAGVDIDAERAVTRQMLEEMARDNGTKVHRPRWLQWKPVPVSKDARGLALPTPS